MQLREFTMKNILSCTKTAVILLLVTVLFLGFYAYMLTRPISYGMSYSNKAVYDGKTFKGNLTFYPDGKMVNKNTNFDEALEIVRDMADKYPIKLVNSVNPYRIEGQKTAAFEMCDVLGQAPDYLCIPVGNAGNITAYWKGFTEYFNKGIVKNKPIMCGFEAEGAASIVKGERIMKPETIATAIRIGNPASWKQAEAARDESGGLIDSVTDEEIIEAYRIMARTEGILAEPASAASVAGLYKSYKAGKIQEGSTIACVLTGNGLKDPDSAIKYSNTPVQKVSTDINKIAAVLNL